MNLNKTAKSLYLILVILIVTIGVTVFIEKKTPADNKSNTSAPVLSDSTSTNGEAQSYLSRLIYLINVDDPLLEEFQIELDLSNNQLNVFKNLLAAQREKDFLVRSLGYVEMGIKRGDLSKEEGEKRIATLKTELDSLQTTLSITSFKDIFTQYQYELLKEWVATQEVVNILIGSALEGIPKSKDDSYKLLNELWDRDGTKRIESILDDYVAKRTQHLELDLGLNAQQASTLTNIERQNNFQITELRKDMSFFASVGDNLKAKEFLSEIAREKAKKDDLIERILTSGQNIKFKTMKIK